MATIVWTWADGGQRADLRKWVTCEELTLMTLTAPTSARFLLREEARMQTIERTRSGRRPVVVLCSSARPKRRIDRGG